MSRAFLLIFSNTIPSNTATSDACTGLLLIGGHAAGASKEEIPEALGEARDDWLLDLEGHDALRRVDSAMA
jgi:hypothetical protein